MENFGLVLCIGGFTIALGTLVIGAFCINIWLGFFILGASAFFGGAAILEK